MEVGRTRRGWGWCCTWSVSGCCLGGGKGCEGGQARAFPRLVRVPVSHHCREPEPSPAAWWRYPPLLHPLPPPHFAVLLPRGPQTSARVHEPQLCVESRCGRPGGEGGRGSRTQDSPWHSELGSPLRSDPHLLPGRPLWPLWAPAPSESAWEPNDSDSERRCGRQRSRAQRAPAGCAWGPAGWAGLPAHAGARRGLVK